MWKHYSILSIFILTLGFPMEGLAKRKKRRRAKQPKISVSITNGYTFHNFKKSSVEEFSFWSHLDGQMNGFFSSLDIARNFGRYELGGKIQFIGPTFVSPFLKLNIINKNSRFPVKPSFTIGIVTSDLMGFYARLSLGLALNKYLVLNPFGGLHFWYNIKDNSNYEKSNVHFNAGLMTSLYF